MVLGGSWPSTGDVGTCGRPAFLHPSVQNQNRPINLARLDIGTAEGERFHNSVKNYRNALETPGIKTVFCEFPGTAHEWQTRRRSLKEFAPLLFK